MTKLYKPLQSTEVKYIIKRVLLAVDWYLVCRIKVYIRVVHEWDISGY